MNTHLILFLKQNTNINFEELVNKIEESYKDLGKGLILKTESKNPNQPKFIFNSNKKILMDGNNHHIAINILNDYNTITKDIIEILWDAFDYAELEFSRVGYITEIPYKINDLTPLKKKLLNKDLVDEINEFQISYHNTIKFQRKNINCWRRFIKYSSSPLIISYDINTKDDNFNEINYKTLKEFIKFSELFIDEDIKNYIKGEMV